MADDPNPGPTSPQTIWPDPARVKQLTDLAREPTAGKPISDYFPGIDPSDPAYELATNLLKEHPHAMQVLSIALRDSQRKRISSSPLPTRPETAGAKTTRKLGSVQSPGASDQQSSVLYEAAQRMNLTRQATATAALGKARPTPSVTEALMQAAGAARSAQEQPQEDMIDTLAQQARARALAQADWSKQFAEQGIGAKLAQICIVLLACHPAVAKAMKASKTARSKAQEAAERAEQAGLAARQSRERAEQFALTDRQTIERAGKLGLLTPAQQAVAASYYIPSPLTIADYRQVSLRTKMATAAILTALAKPQLSKSPVASARVNMENTRLLFEALDRIEGVWAEDGLWFVFSRLNHASVFLFEKLTQREQIEAAVIDALERVCKHGMFIEVLCNAIGRAPHLTDYQREILAHGLEHVQRGEYRLAIAHLMDGLESALVGMAVDQAVIDDEQWIVGKPKGVRKNRLYNVDAIIKLMPLDEGYARFLHRCVFGKRGNPIRHGNLQGNERERALMIVVALAGWMDSVKIPASITLVNAMSGYLPETVSRQRQLVA